MYICVHSVERERERRADGASLFIRSRRSLEKLTLFAHTLGLIGKVRRDCQDMMVSRSRVEEDDAPLK